MSNKLNKRKSLIVVIVVIFLTLISFLIYNMFFKTKQVIKFNEKALTIEYGEVLDFSKSIESVEPENAKIEYPNIEVKEVGTYHLTFTYTIDGKKGTQEQDFVVKDTKLPKVTLKNEKTVEALANSQYDLFSNIKEYKNLSDEAIQNRQLFSNKEYKKIKEDVDNKSEELSKREISSNKDIKEIVTVRNCIVYTTKFDITKEGTYKVKAMFIDENYNIDEQEWKVKVVPAGQIVNSGGTVSCVFPNENMQTNEAYVTDYSEIYTYDENKLVTTLNFMTKMTFKEDYDTNENINALTNAINEKYAGYMSHKGIAVNVEASSNAVVTNIIIDFNEYDLKNDPLNLLETKDSGKVQIEKVVDKMKDKAACELY